ncbi:hypothetical protein JTB14_018347 [Gonioctena quinquepunctata]|nr:hypothetical protein JTB14_018347 [Gonioctena quinquepunctata]
MYGKWDYSLQTYKFEEVSLVVLDHFGTRYSSRKGFYESMKRGISRINLFKEHVRNFMKIKLETSHHTYASNAFYVQVIEGQTGIDLDMEKMAPNPNEQAVARICLTSLWGKFGQRQNLSQTEFIVDPKRWYEILLDDKLYISNCLLVNENKIQVTYNVYEYFCSSIYNIQCSFKIIRYA